ncbi:hypothetical protein SAMN05216224_108133 [Thioclava dalianensis]|uniref:hypothetical protein n=1 Tax=Thioclava dalianensis TaxID=1185766 RepID=UPI00068EC0FE|nr:hypothetical protein [Thioclava dalianensis]SFN64917.1 hypothetical protein SAMN05216224_108133 [Thioclava dalianensis]
MRIVGIDVTRSVAIFMAMGSHALIAANAYAFLHGPGIDTLRFAIQMAPPIFIILFGTMLEFVYVPRARAGKFEQCSARLVSRALQCWVLYAVSVLVLWRVDPQVSLLYSISTILMMGITPFTDILKFYALALLLAPLIIGLRLRFGLLPIALVAVAVHLVFPILHAIPAPKEFGFPKEINRLAMFFFGIGDAKLGGPSVLHGLSLVVFGMVFGSIFSARSNGPALSASTLERKAWYVLAGAGTLALVQLFVIDRETIHGIANMQLRMESHPIYFLSGVIWAYFTTALLILVTLKARFIPERFWESCNFFGRTSLFTFSFGNMAFYILRGHPDTLQQSLLLTLLGLVVVTLMSFFFDRYARRGGRFAAWLASIRMLSDRIGAACVAWVFAKGMSRRSS